MRKLLIGIGIPKVKHGSGEHVVASELELGRAQELEGERLVQRRRDELVGAEGDNGEGDGGGCGGVLLVS